MPGADDLMMRIYAAITQKERELISERTKAALAAAKARGWVLGGDRGWRPTKPPCARAAALERKDAADRTAHRLLLEVQALKATGISTHKGLAQALTERGVQTPSGSSAWTHTTVARVVARTAS
jgi:DNA invertase Pin-like site-specific DNA recombinase